MRARQRILVTGLCLAVTTLGASAVAQEKGRYGEPAPRLQETELPEAVATESAPPKHDSAHEQTIAVNVRVGHGGQGDASLANLPVLLQAARARGPFETSAPKPEFELTAVTGQDGVARFDAVPESIINRGLRVHALVNYAGISFASAPVTPSRSTAVDVKVYDKGHDPSGITVSTLRMIVEPWEDYLVFTQFWTLSVQGDHALDVSLLADPKFERGLPIALPTKAKGIHVSGAGQSDIVNSIVYWKGVLVPNQPVTVQVRYSMSAKSTEFVFEQVMDYPTQNVEIIAPLQTQYKKVPRLDRLEMFAPGFTVGAGAGLAGLRSDMEFLTASGKSVAAGQKFTFALHGLPFEQPIGPWLALAMGAAGAMFVFGYGRREHKRLRTSEAAGVALDALTQERDLLFDQLADLERQRLAEEIAPANYESDSWLLRERIALLLKKIQDVEAAA
ncbi:MAG: hypothetical protein H0U74_06425 [Bradymonadaceae bacterium]|nr:hypothetical protein [Lujinxingiaceae bacterium]